MAEIAVQYLESAKNVSPENAREKLNLAFRILPISKVIIGWNLPQYLLDVCAEECARFQAELYRWQPLLTSDAVFVPKPQWYTIGLNDKPVIHLEEPEEFTFACPNHADVRETVIAHLSDIADQNIYHGFFLDRIRYPSPMASPLEELGCFCPYCRDRAAEQGLDLERAKKAVVRVLKDPRRVFQFVRLLLGADSIDPEDEDLCLLKAFLDFRVRSIGALVQSASSTIRASGAKVGLDCFSPALAYAVGQDLGALNRCADWIKIMSYGHTLGIAGLPFELSGLAEWMIGHLRANETEIYRFLSDLTQLGLPGTKGELFDRGVPSRGLAREVALAAGKDVTSLFAGIELVDLDRFAVLNDEQIASDLSAFKKSGVLGLVLSWDLWHIPEERLHLVRRIWSSD